jgi:hypothetical protein
MGDEPLNPFIPKKGYRTSVKAVLDDSVQDDIETDAIYKEVKEKFECYHIYVDHGCYYDWYDVAPSFQKLMGEQRVLRSTVENIEQTIVDIVKSNANKDTENGFVGAAIIDVNKDENGDITW